MSRSSAAGTEPELTERDLHRIVHLVYERSGITLHDGKRPLIVARLQKRLRRSGFASYAAYLAHVEADVSGQAVVDLLDAIATNHTSFFREAQHFDVLTSRVLAEWRSGGSGRRFDVWSAACSTGEEPYSIAMTLAGVTPGVDFRIIASDLSTTALRTAATGVYRMETLQALSREQLRRHFERGFGEQTGLARVSVDLKQKVSFRRHNLLDIGDLGPRFDAIFCRNVMIYFDRAVQQRVVSMLERHLQPQGYLFISHSESLNGLAHGLRWVAPAVYQRGHRA